MVFLFFNCNRGNLNLSLLPTSELRISFIGDDGSSERLGTLSNDLSSFTVEVEELIADPSGRSFSIRNPDDEIFYFWCSEKSKLLGMELLRKMKDLLDRKPSLCELTGISESRLDSFAIHLRAYLLGSTMTPSLNSSIESSQLNSQSSAVSLKPSRFKHNGSHGAKHGPSYQGSLSPRSSSFKEAVQRNLSSLKSVGRDKLRRRGDSYISSIDNLTMGSPINPNACGSISSESELPEGTANNVSPSSSFIESLGKSVVEPPTLNPAGQVPLVGSSLFSPYYCWCPPVASTLQFTGGTPLITSCELPSLPSSLLSVTSSLLVSKTPLNVSEVVPSLDLPPLLPEPLVRFPLSLPTSQQIPTFTPLMCDPIVHIPVIDVCSSGQGYLVSAGPAISSAIPSLHPTLVSPLIPEGDSMVEKGARETLRMLISGSSNQASPPLIDVLPSILTNSDERQSILAAGSRGLYLGTIDVDATSSIAVMGLMSSSEKFVGCSALGRCSSKENLVDKKEISDGSSSVDFPNIEEEREQI